MSKYIDADKLKAEIERRESEIKSQIAGLGNFESNEIGLFNYLDLYDDILSFITSLQQEQPECIEKTARISPGLLSNFGTSTYVLDVDLSQDEIVKVASFGFNSGKIKIKIVCE